jgi:hypothetical protein
MVNKIMNYGDLHSEQFSVNYLEILAENWIRTTLKSSDVEKYFGNYFGLCPYKYTKKMFPIVKVQKDLFYNYVTSLQFTGMGLNDEWRDVPKIENLNSLLKSINCQELKPSLIDFSTIEKMQFKV